MKVRNFYIIVILSVFYSPLFSQTDVTKINFQEKEYDFGTVKSGDEAIHYFVFINEGSVPLAISNVRTSCGCAVPEWPQKPVLSGMRDSLKVEYNTKIKGAFNKTVSVYMNDSRGMIELRIKGNVVKAK